MERKVVIASAKSNAAARTQFSGSTFGDLKNDTVFASIYGDGAGVEAVVKPGNITLRGNDSVLPEGEFSVFLVPTKNKAGQFDIDDIMSDLTDEISEDFETVVDSFAESVKDEIVTAAKAIIAKYADKAVDPEVAADSELSSALNEARSL